MASLARPRIRQPDIVEWCTANRPAIKALAAERWQLEKGVLDYLRDAAEFIREMRSSKKDEATDKDKAIKEETKKPDLSAVDQYYASQDLLKRMKWKRVTWDVDADYDAFARRVMDNDTVFSKIPAFSHMAIHVVRDKSARSAPSASSADKQVTSIQPGSLTKWFLEERKYGTAECPRPVFTPAPKVLQAPFTVDWEAGTVRILDSASVQEMLVYLTAAAPRVQALQQRMEDEQTKLTEDLDSARVRLGVTAIKFNRNDKAFWDDPERAKDRGNYVTPAEVRMFLDAVFKRSLLVRKYVKHNQIRIVPAGKPYAIDPVEKEIRIPANFAEYNWIAIHERYQSIESLLNFFRRTALAWFFVGMMLVGDFELL